MSRLSLAGVVKEYASRRREPPVRALDGLEVEVEAGSFFTLLGPSGCGKTTALRCVAGLELPDAGTVSLGERLLFSRESRLNVPTSARRVAMVFQSAAVWPHMTLAENVAFPLRVARSRRRMARGEVQRRVAWALAAVRLEGLGERRATDISGGQQQRIALARALVMEPALLLLDEPLSNVDAPLRQQLRSEIKRLQGETGITTVYVTHDQSEALALSGVVAVMRAGRVEQVGRPRAVYERPRSRFVADFIGAANVVDGRLEGPGANGNWVVETELGPLTALPLDGFRQGDRVGVVLRPEQIALEPLARRSPADGRRGIVESADYLGDCVDYLVRVGDALLRARAQGVSSIVPGAAVELRFRGEPCALVPA